MGQSTLGDDFNHFHAFNVFSWNCVTERFNARRQQCGSHQTFSELDGHKSIWKLKAGYFPWLARLLMLKVVVSGARRALAKLSKLKNESPLASYIRRHLQRENFEI
jgi:hypothetical protein